MAGSGHRASRKPSAPEPAAEPEGPPQKARYDSRFGPDPGTRISPKRISDFIDRVFGDGPAKRERDAA